MNMGERVTFNQLLDYINFIEIPIIQRDYAQGRKEQSEVRDTFLNSLFSALTINKSDNNKQTLNLDFIYGDIDSTETLSVLDGQQRLTTLFLLHWFLAVRYNHLTEFKAKFTLDNNSRFTYKTRPSSSEFFDALVSNSTIQQRYHTLTDTNVDKSTGSIKINEYTIDQIIANSTWFFSAWEQDPTVQACLNMLKAIEKRFALCNDDLYLRILDSNNPCITFQFLPLSKFGLSDELYIKMNARGKSLTPFENFKANLQQTIKSFSKELPSYYLAARNTVVNGYEYFIHKIDTDWADLFWTYRTVGDNPDTYDDELMNFIRLIILYQYLLDNSITSKEASKDDLAMLLGSKSTLPSVSISQYKELNCLNPAFTKRLISTFDIIYSPLSQTKNFKTHISDNEYYDESALFEKVLQNSTNYTEKLRFFAFYTYIINRNAELDKADAKHWTRVIYNLTENTEIDSAESFYRALHGINHLIQIKLPILDVLIKNTNISGFLGDQILEERIKAHLLIKSIQWVNAVLQAEKHSFFKGQIGFLLNFSGILAFYREHGHCHWLESDDEMYFSQFEKYTSSASAVFDLIRESSSSINYLWERSVLSKGVYFTQKGGDRYNLLSTRLSKNHIERDHSWKRLLRISSENEKSKVVIEPKQAFVKSVLDDSNFNANHIKQSLQSICHAALATNKLDKWREYLVQYPQLFAYCKQGFIEISEEKLEIFLLSQSQRNHYHSELYTLVLNIQLKDKIEKLIPFSNLEYQSVKSTQEQSSIVIGGWNYANSEYHFEIINFTNNFIIQFRNGTSNDYPQKVTCMIENNGLQREYNTNDEGHENIYYEISSLTSVDDVIDQLIQTCSSLRDVENE